MEFSKTEPEQGDLLIYVTS